MKREYIVTRKLTVEVLLPLGDGIDADVLEGNRSVGFISTLNEGDLEKAITQKLQEYGTVRPADEPDPIRAALQEIVEAQEDVLVACHMPDGSGKDEILQHMERGEAAVVRLDAAILRGKEALR